MKIVNIIGGLGNQMFQYAFALALKDHFPDEEILIDTSHFHYIFTNQWKGTNLHNGYEIDKIFPNANLQHASITQLAKVTYVMPNYILSRIIRKYFPIRKSEYVQNRKDIFTYLPNVFTIKGDCYYEGNWESAKFYISNRSHIQDAFAHGTPNETNSNYINEIEATNSIGIHIRRGDYLNSSKWTGLCDLDYYKRGIVELLSDGLEHSFYIFSNDKDWCRENILPLCNGNKVVLVTENTGDMSCWDLFLMYHCKDLIIANSSFSWWAAFLNKRNGRIVAPKKWVNEDRVFDIWLDEWIRL